MAYTGAQEFEWKDHKLEASLKLHSKTPCQQEVYAGVEGEEPCQCPEEIK